MESNVKYTKKKYREEIANKGKTILDIASERGMTATAVRKEIRGLYIYRAYAEQLIGVADANEKARRNCVSAPADMATTAGVTSTKVCRERRPVKKKRRKTPLAMRLALERGVGIVDTSYAIDYYDECRKIKQIIMPIICLNEMRTIAKFKTGKEKEEINKKIKFFEENAEILFVKTLPELPSEASTLDYKNRSLSFARYVKHLWNERGFGMPYLSRSYEVNTLVRKYVSVKAKNK